MDLEDLQSMPSPDQHTFLLGRISAEALRMDIALRFLNGALRGHNNFDAYLDAPDGFRANARECAHMAEKHDGLSDEVRHALLRAIESASMLYAHRNRFTHDLLRHGLDDNSIWELARVSRPRGEEPIFKVVSFDHMVTLVCDLVAVTWQLRAGGLHLANGSGWKGLLLGAVEGEWDGSATWIG